MTVVELSRQRIPRWLTDQNNAARLAGLAVVISTLADDVARRVARITWIGTADSFAIAAATFSAHLPRNRRGHRELRGRFVHGALEPEETGMLKLEREVEIPSEIRRLGDVECSTIAHGATVYHGTAAQLVEVGVMWSFGCAPKGLTRAGWRVHRSGFSRDATGRPFHWNCRRLFDGTLLLERGPNLPTDAERAAKQAAADRAAGIIVAAMCGASGNVAERAAAAIADVLEGRLPPAPAMVFDLQARRQSLIRDVGHG